MKKLCFSLAAFIFMFLNSCDYFKLMPLKDWYDNNNKNNISHPSSTVTFVGVGTVVSEASSYTTITPGIPNGVQPGDLLCFFVASSNGNTIGNTDGWTAELLETRNWWRHGSYDNPYVWS